MSYTLVIKRAFAPNKDLNGRFRDGTSPQDVHDVMMQFGTINRIEFIEKKDTTNHDTLGQMFRVFFIHYNSLTMDENLKNALDSGANIEVDNDDYGHYWLVAKYTKSVKKADTLKKTRGVRIRASSAGPRQPPPPLDITLDNMTETNPEFIPPPAPVCDDGHTSLMME